MSRRDTGTGHAVSGDTLSVSPATDKREDQLRRLSADPRFAAWVAGQPARDGDAGHAGHTASLDEATPAELRAMQERRELLRRAAASVVADHNAGRVVDPHTLTWARQVVQNNAPLQGWLGDGRPGANTTESR